MPESDEILFPLDDPDLIALNIGAPDQSLLPVDILKRQVPEALASSRAYKSLQYGPSLGSLSFRQTLAEFLSKEYDHVRVEPEHLCVTSGASQSFFNLITLLTDVNTLFLVENPTYFLALKMLHDHPNVLKDHIHGIDVDDDEGISVDAVEKVLVAHKDRVEARQSSTKNGVSKRFSFFLFLVPTFSNPTGTCLSAIRRKRLVALARQYDMLIVCDDVYQLLHFGSDIPPPRLVSYDLESLNETIDKFGNVISNCSFSKLFAPGMRLGWVEAGPGLIQILKNAALLYSGGCSNHFGASLMTQVIQSGGLSAHLDRVRKEYEARCQSMLQTLQEGLSTPSRITIHSGFGGYFIWLEFLDKTVDTEALLQALLGHGPSYRGVEPGEKVLFTPGNRFSVNGTHGHCLRLSFGMYPIQDLKKGCERLVRVLNKVTLGSH